MKSPSLTGHRFPQLVSSRALLLATIAVMVGRAEGQTPCFDAPYVLPTDSFSRGIATADFDGDGILDLAIADGTLAIARGVGDGTFHLPLHIGQLGDASTVLRGDFDGDGDIDIAVSDIQFYTVTIFRNDGTGSFTSSTLFAGYPDPMVLGDFDGDGDPDLAVGGSGSVRLLRNTGGTFATWTTLTFSPDSTAMIAGDFDGNGTDELVVSSFNGTTLTQASFVGGQFVYQPIAATHLIYALAACDVDGDGDLDIVASDTGTSVILNSGAGSFAAPIPFAGQGGASILIPLDLDGNTLSDIAFVSPPIDINYIPQAIYVRMATGGGALSAATSYPVAYFTGGLTAGDFDGDGRMDMASTDGRGCVRIFHNQGNGTFDAVAPIAAVPTPGAVDTADLDGDGDLDVVAADWLNANVSILLNQSGTLAAPANYPIAARPDHVVLADFDGDGDLDLALIGHTSPAVSVLLNNGNGTFAPFAMYSAPNTAIDIAAADLDGDGDVDLAILNGSTSAASVLTLLLNNGSGVFAASPPQSLFGVMTAFALGDMDGDGDFDAVVSSTSPGQTLQMFRNSGSGTFVLAFSLDVGGSSKKVLLADLDADGDLDVAEAILPDQVVICSNFQGALVRTANARTGQSALTLRAADFDADGFLDLATCGPAYAVSILRNQGNGFFDPPILRASYAGAYDIAPADIDGDGYTDILVSHSQNASLSLLHACSNQAGTSFCSGDGSATACPCGNASPVGADAGCLNSFGTGGTLRALGFAHLANDTLVLVGAGMPNAAALYFQGTTRVGGGAGAVFGDGLRCVAGTVVRLGVKTNSAGMSQNPSAGDPPLHVRGGITGPAVRYYQVWYRNSAAFCTSATFNLTNGLVVNWTP